MDLDQLPGDSRSRLRHGDKIETTTETLRPKGKPETQVVVRAPRVANITRKLVSIQPRLPAPEPPPTSLRRTILKSQVPRQPKECYVCGKRDCQLRTHQQFAQWAKPMLSHDERSSSLTSSSTQSPTYSQIGNPRIDPFARYPIPMTEEDHFLLDLWSQPWGKAHRGPERHLFPVPIINLYLETAMANPTLFVTMLSVTASQWALSAFGRVDERAIRKQLEALKMHVQEFADERSASTDANLLAGLGILSNHMAAGKLHESHALIKGINQLVELRGGPQYLGINGVVAHYLMFADHTMAVIQCEEPVWKMITPSIEIRSSFPPQMGHSFKTMYRSQELGDEVLNLALDMCKLTSLFDLGSQGKIPAAELQVVGYLSMVINYQLAHLNAVHHQHPSRDQCVVLALLIYDHVVLSNAGVINPGIRQMEARFWTAFQIAEAQGEWDISNSGLVLWTLFTGLTIIIRAECPWKEYAVSRLCRVREKMMLDGWDDVKRLVLQQFLFYSVAQEAAYYEIWTEVENLRLSQHNQD